MKHWLSALCLTLAAGLTLPAAASNPAPDFQFTTVSGHTLKLSNFRGRWVLVNFWAPWCPRCKMDFPALNDLDARPDFVVIGVAMDYGIDVGSVHSTINRYNLRFPQVIGGNRRDPNSPALQVGPVDFYPTSYLYAPNGEIVMFVPGIISRQRITAFIDNYNANAVAAAPARPGVQNATIQRPATRPARSAPPAQPTRVF